MKKSLFIITILLFTFIIVGCKDKTYTVTYYVDGAVYHTENETKEINFPTNPEKNGYTFEGWYSDNSFISLVEDKREIDKDHSLYAKFSLFTYTITYYLHGGINSENNPTTYTVEDTPFILENPKKEGYIFKGWYNDGDLYHEFDPTICKHINLVATWDVIDYSINYNLDGGTNSTNNPNGYNVEDEEFILEEPTKQGYKFLGWVDEEQNVITKIDPSLNKNITLNATWELINYSISYKTNGGFNSSSNPISYNVSEVITFEECKKNGYDFLYWVDENENVISTTENLFVDLVLTAVYEISKYDVTFVSPTGEVLSIIENVEYNTRIKELPLFNYSSDLNVELYHFYRNTWTKFNYKLDKIESDTTVYLNVYNKNDVFTNDNQILISYTGTSSTLYIPWIINGVEIKSIGLDVFSNNIFDKVYIPNNIKEVNARAFKNCQINTIVGLENLEFIGPNAFEGNSFASVTLGENIQTVSNNAFSNNSNLQEIIIENEEGFIIEENSFTGNFIIYVPNNTYKQYVSFEHFDSLESRIYEEGKNKVIYHYLDIENTFLNPNDEKVKLENIEITGYDILGYYLDNEYQNEFTSKVYKEDINIYCKIELHKYNINYVLDEGIFDNGYPENFTMLEEVDLINPNKHGYIFIGWFTEPEFFTTPIEKIKAGTVNDVTLYAKYVLDDNAEFVNLTIIDIDGITEYTTKSVIKGINISNISFDLYNDYIVEFYTKDDANQYTLFTSTIEEDMTLYVNYYTEGFTISAGTVSTYYGEDLEKVVIPWIYKGTLVETLGTGSTGIFMDSNTRVSVNVTSLYVPRTVKTINAYAFYNSSIKMEIFMQGACPKVGNNSFNLYPTTYIYVQDEYYEEYKTSLKGTSSYFDYTKYVLKNNEFIVIFADYYETTGMVRSEYSRVISNVRFIPEKIKDPVVTNAVFAGWYLDSTLTNQYNFDIELTSNTILYPKFIVQVNITLTDILTNEEVGNGIISSNEVLSDELIKQMLGDNYNGEMVYEIYNRAQYDSSTGKYTYTYINKTDEISVIVGSNTYASFYVLKYDKNIIIENDTVISYNGEKEEVVIPEMSKGITITKIGNEAFKNNSFVKTVTLPTSIKTIEDYAFYGTSLLETLNILSDVAPIIGTKVFDENSKLAIIPSVNNGYNRSDWDEYREYVAVTVTVTYMNFYSTYKEIKVKMGSVLKKPADPTTYNGKFIGWYIDSSLTIPFDFNNAVNEDLVLYAKFVTATYVYIYDNDGTYLASIETYPEEELDLSEYAKEIEGYETYYVLYASNTYSKYEGSIPENISYPSIYIYYLPIGLSIENGKVTSYSGTLKDIIIPERDKNGIIVSEIDISAFKDNEVIETVTMSSITKINDEAFNNCKLLKNIYINSESAPIIGENVFDITNENLLIVPAFASTGYETNGWEKYQNLLPTYATVLFLYNETEYLIVKVEKGQKLELPDNPENTNNQRFAGWYSDSLFTIEFDFENITITKDTTIYGKYINAKGINVYVNNNYIGYVYIFDNEIISTEILSAYLAQITPVGNEKRTCTLQYTNSTYEQQTIDVIIDETVLPSDYNYGDLYITIE